MNDALTPQAVIEEAERYCAAAGIKLSSLGLYAVDNSRFFANLKAGRSCLVSTLDRVRQYMVDNPRPASGAAEAKRETVNALTTPAREDAA